MPAEVPVVSDTGPLLCAGGFKEHGVRLLGRRYGTRFHIHSEVVAELSNHADRTGSRLHKRAQAARRLRFPTEHDLAFDPSVVQQVVDDVVAAERRRAERRAGRREPKLTGHEGEAYAILLAEHLGGVLLTNDLSARDVAISRGLLAGTFATVLAAEVQGGGMVAPDAAKVCLACNADDVFPGLHDHEIAPLRFTSMPVPEGL